MKVHEAIAEITAQKRSKITYDLMGNALSLTRQRIGQILEKELSDLQIEKLENYFNVKLTNVKLNNSIGCDRIELPYWPELPEELKNSKVVSCWFDREIIENDWGKNPETLYIVTMPDSGMSHFWYPMRQGNILIIDTKQINISETGVYFATSQNNTKFWVREIQELLNKNYEFRNYSVSGEIIKTYTRQQLQDVDFKIIGKVIKNMSFII